LYALCLLYTRTQAYHLFFAMSINCSIILLTVLNLMLCYIELELKLIRMLRRCIIKVYVLSI